MPESNDDDDDGGWINDCNQGRRRQLSTSLSLHLNKYPWKLEGVGLGRLQITTHRRYVELSKVCNG